MVQYGTYFQAQQQSDICRLKQGNIRVHQCDASGDRIFTDLRQLTYRHDSRLQCESVLRSKT